MKTDDILLPRLDSELLRTFLAIATEGSVSRGAARVLRTQSAASVQLKKLEEVVGHRLFQRHGRGVELTERGERLLPIARSVIASLDDAVADMRGACGRGAIRIGIPDEYGEGILVAILSRFSTAQPGTQVIVHCGSSMEFPEAVAGGRLDVALYSPANVKSSDLIVCRERAVWASSKFHDLANRRPLPVALFDKLCWWRDRSVSILKKSGLDFHIVCTSESVAGVRAAIASGIAVGVLPESSLTPDLRILSELPHLGSSPLVLGVSPGAPDRLAKAMIAAISATLQGKG